MAAAPPLDECQNVQNVRESEKKKKTDRSGL